MALTAAFLNTCRTACSSLSELTAFRAALQNIGTGTRAERTAAWNAAYATTNGGQSLAYRLRVAIRETVNAQADISGALGGVGSPDRQTAYTTLEAEFAPQADRPISAVEEKAALDILFGRT